MELVIYDNESNTIFIITGHFKDEELDINFSVIDDGYSDGIMDSEYLDKHCEVLGWL